MAGLGQTLPQSEEFPTLISRLNRTAEVHVMEISAETINRMVICDNSMNVKDHITRSNTGNYTAIHISRFHLADKHYNHLH